MVQIEAEAIAEIAYDTETSRMFVRFTEGNWYTILRFRPEPMKNSSQRRRTAVSSTTASVTVSPFAEDVRLR